MANIQNSDLLDRLIEYAKKIGNNENTQLTAERFLTAVCDYIDGSFAVEESESKIALSKLIKKTGADTVKIKAFLLKHILDEKNTSHFGDGIYIQKKIFEAKSKAQENNASELTPEILLKCVLEEPTELIKKSLANGDDSFANSDIPSGSPKDDIDLLFQELLDRMNEKSDEKNEKSDGKKALSEIVQKVKNTRETLLSSIFGQDNAVNIFVNGYFQAELRSLTDNTHVRPLAAFLFAGPPGVGKTFLAEKAAEALKLSYMRFDMSEYADRDANLEFCGSDHVWRGSKEGNVTSFVAAHPKCLLLFDEVEKADICVIHLFLQILDGGRLRDKFTDIEVSFSDAIIIFTTNAGKQLYDQSEAGDFSGLSRKVIIKALQNDINSHTRLPFFPPELCSRFASGNVVMFNYLKAHDLRRVAKTEVLKQTSNFEKKFGIQIDIDEFVYTALLFAEGGAADARAVKGRSELFFNEELFELFRLVTSDNSSMKIGSIEKININVLLPQNDKRLFSLFVSEKTPDVLLLSDKKTAKMCIQASDCCKIFIAGSVDEAAKILRDNEIELILIELAYGRRNEDVRYLNLEDVGSVAGDFFRYIRENHLNIPIYFLKAQDMPLDYEEEITFKKLGVRGIIELDDKSKPFGAELKKICENIYQQNSMGYLAKANKIISFETAQYLSDNGKTAWIRLFNFKMTTAVDSKDSQNILGNISKPEVRFDQVIGAEDAKRELRYFVEYLKNPKKFTGTGVRPPKGVILYGPPGTGKTMLAKAMAYESDVTFIVAEGNEFLQKYIGEGKDRLHELFRVARKYAPSILFIDEIDSIAQKRQGGEQSFSRGEDVLTALLTEMDGFKNYPSRPVFVLAATNFDVAPGQKLSLDQSLMRRFDRKVYIELPNKDERTQYIKLKLSSNDAFQVSEEQIANIAVRSTGMSLANLESVFELALRSAIRDGNFKVTDCILEEAFETFNSGDKKKWDNKLLERVARHESGHAFICWQSGETPSYVTIVARGEHGGYMQHSDNEGKSIYTKDDLLAKIRISLGGRAAELVYYGEKDGISTGAGQDLKSATEIANQLICTYGMDKEFGLAVIDKQSLKNTGFSHEIRRAVNKILDEQMGEAIRLITEGKTAIDALVKELMDKNHLSGPKIDKIFQDSYIHSRQATKPVITYRA